LYRRPPGVLRCTSNRNLPRRFHGDGPDRDSTRFPRLDDGHPAGRIVRRHDRRPGGRRLVPGARSRQGRPLWTPGLLGSLLLHGSSAARSTTIQPFDVAAYTAFHFLVFIAVGVVLSYLMTLFERFSDHVLRAARAVPVPAGGILRVRRGARRRADAPAAPWAVVVGNLLAAGTMSLYLWKRHPQVMRGIEHLWEDDADK